MTPQGARREPEARFVAFEGFLVDRVERRLLRDGEPVHLTPRVFTLLVALLDRPGRVWSREDLIERVWQGRIVEDASLTQNVFVLRKALGDGGETSRLILTEPGIGYRFIGTVTEPPPEPDAEPDSEVGEPLVDGDGGDEPPAAEAADSSLGDKLCWSSAALFTALALVVAFSLLRGWITEGADGGAPPEEAELAAGAGEGRGGRGQGDGDAAGAHRATRIPEAYESAELGWLFLRDRNPADLMRSREAFERATELDPRYAAAYAGLADAETLLGFYQLGDRGTREHFTRARRAAERALELDPDLVDPRTVLAIHHLQIEHDLAASEAVFETALEMAPGSPRVHHWYGWHLATAGRLEEAAASLERAHELAPVSLIVRSAQGLVAYYRGRHGEAQSHFDAALGIRPDFGRGHLNRALVCVELRRFEQAAGELDRARDLLGATAEVEAADALLAMRSGRPDAWAEIVARLERRGAPAVFVALAYAPGDSGKALDHLEEAYRDRSAWPWLLVDPRLGDLRGKERFHRLPFAPPPPAGSEVASSAAGP